MVREFWIERPLPKTELTVRKAKVMEKIVDNAVLARLADQLAVEPNGFPDVIGPCRQHFFTIPRPDIEPIKKASWPP